MVGQKPSLMTGLAENEGNKDINNKQQTTITKMGMTVPWELFLQKQISNLYK